MRLIDAETLKSRIGELCINNDDLFSTKGYERIIGVIEAVPTIEEEPILLGLWTDNGEDKYICSNCKGYVFRWFGKRNYCPNCGAKMYVDGGTISKERLAEIMGGAENGWTETVSVLRLLQIPH